MLTFKKVDAASLDILRKYYEICTYGLSDYTAGLMIMWEPLVAEYAEAAGCLITKVQYAGRVYFHYPIPLAEGDVDAALSLIEEYCLEKRIPLSFSAVTREKLSHMAERYPFHRVGCIRPWQDYIYRSEDMRNFAGKHYSGQRNHINKFFKLYPEASFRKLTVEDLPDINSFFDIFESNISADEKGKLQELSFTRKLFRLIDSPAFKAGCIEYGGKMIAVSLGEICGETMIVHIEKALSEYEGVYPTMVREFARAFGEDVKWFNREDDAAEKGLRTSKLQYRPSHMGEKFCIEVENELSFLEELPEIETEHLLLTPIHEIMHESAERQEALYCHMSVAFNMMLEGERIGEIKVDAFDFHGGAELELHIDPETYGYQYACEAFLALKDWALYTLGLRVVRSKCSVDDSLKQQLLASCMRPMEKDETTCYYGTVV